MNGELDFAEALKARVALLKGVPADVFERLKPTITITPGARELCKALKRLGFKMAVLSGGFAPLAEWLAGELGLDYAYANHVRSKSHTLQSSKMRTYTSFASYPLRSIATTNTIPSALAPRWGPMRSSPFHHPTRASNRFAPSV